MGVKLNLPLPPYLPLPMCPSDYIALIAMKQAKDEAEGKLHALHDALLIQTNNEGGTQQTNNDQGLPTPPPVPAPAPAPAPPAEEE